MGKMMRSVVVRNLREALPRGQQPPPQEKVAPEINVCCHGQDAGDEVRRHLPALPWPVRSYRCTYKCASTDFSHRFS